MLTQAGTLNKNYEKEAEESEFGGLFGAEKEMLNVKNVNSKFSSIITDIKFPQFVVDVSANIFGETKTLVTKETLLNDFSLLDKHIPTSLSETKDQAVKVDLESTDSQDVKLTTRSVNERELTQFKKHLEQLPDERKKGLLAEAIYKNLEGMNNITASELKSFIKRIVNSLKVDELYAVKDNLYSVSYKIKRHIEELKNEYAYLTFENLLEKGIVRVSQDYEIPKSIAPVKSSSIIAKTFYEEESDDLNKTETEIIRTIAGLENIKSWHRIMERKTNEFYINGFTNHYPDFWIITEKNNVIVLEVKGEHLADVTTRRKAKLGKMWQNKAGDQFRYFMVYKDKDMGFEGSYKLNDFLEIIKEL
jgi:type III restriction enzyme